MKLLAGLILALLSSLASAACENPARLRFSLVPQGDVKRDAAIFRPLFDHLARATGKPVELRTPSSYGAVVEGLLAGHIDLAFLGPASYATARQNDADIVPFASYTRAAGPLQEEGPHYRSLLIVRSSAAFPAAADLKGASVALVDPVSTSGAVVPRHAFPGLPNATFDGYFGRVVYSGGHEKSISALLRGEVDAVFVASNHLSDLIVDGKARSQDLRVLWQSEPIPLDPFVYRRNLCPAIREAIRNVFLAAGGRQFPEVLARLQAQRFVAVSDADYLIIHRLLPRPAGSR